MQVGSLGREDPLEKEMATHSSILAWRSLWPEEPGGLQSRRLQSRNTTEVTQHARTPNEPGTQTVLLKLTDEC